MLVVVFARTLRNQHSCGDLAISIPTLQEQDYVVRAPLHALPTVLRRSSFCPQAVLRCLCAGSCLCLQATMFRFRHGSCLLPTVSLRFILDANLLRSQGLVSVPLPYCFKTANAVRSAHILRPARAPLDGTSWALFSSRRRVSLSTCPLRGGRHPRHRVCRRLRHRQHQYHRPCRPRFTTRSLRIRSPPPILPLLLDSTPAITAAPPCKTPLLLLVYVCAAATAASATSREIAPAASASTRAHPHS